MNNTKDELQVKIDNARALLPQESREAIDNVNWKSTIHQMDKKYNQEQLEDLEIETELLLCGLLNPNNYPKELATRMHITEEQAKSLSNEMDNLVFKKIQDELKKIIERNKVTIQTQEQSFTPDPHFSGLPQNVQEAISKSGWREKLYNLAKKYQLSIEQSGVLEETTVGVMKNTIHPDHYESELASKLTNISKENISSLVGEINESILKVIRNTMMERKVVTDREVYIGSGEKLPIPPYNKTGNTPVSTPQPEKTDTIKLESDQAPIKDMHFPTKDTEASKPITSKFELPKVSENMIEGKLKNATTSDHTISDYSASKINNNPIASTPNDQQNQPPKGVDPYRETIN